MLSHHCYKKHINKSLLTILITIFSFILSNTQAYYFWLKSADNTPQNIQNIENQLNVKIPVISFIFDPRDENDVLNSIDKIVELLGSDRIYHFTISPDNFSAEDVVLWKFDNQYTAFFKKIKEKNLHVIFRTMHEMNWWWYPRASNPEKFKAARIHVRTLSRLAWLNQENIAFDFSINHWDMPTKWTPSQSAPLIKCTQWKKDCYHFEDYYPWDEFVDVIWFTFYNRWKAMDNRQRLSPIQILYDKNRKTYERVKSFNKPIIIDEVATTSVWYKWDYSFEKSMTEYLNHDERKDYWLHQLREFLINHPEIIATIYFNTDYTHGLSFKVIWEADWAIINIEDNKVYNWFRDLELFGEKDLDNILKNIFHTQKMAIDWHEVYVSDSFSKQIQEISSIINSKASNINDKISLIQTLQQKNFKSEPINKALSTLNDLYTKISNS
jgi:hypothetical protein